MRLILVFSSSYFSFSSSFSSQGPPHPLPFVIISRPKTSPPTFTPTSSTACSPIQPSSTIKSAPFC